MYCRFLSTLFVAVFLSISAYAADNASPDQPAFELTLKNHVFIPEQLTIPADKSIKLTIKNTDPTPVEFESEDFQAEKVVPAGGEISLYVGPFKPGTYGFYDDFHEYDTKGSLIVQ